MDRLIWTAVSGMSASMAQQRMIASNMANAQTTGFRAEVMAQLPQTLAGPGLEARALNQAAVRGVRMDQGAMVQTSRPLDIALTGDVLLAVQASDGSEAYTRRGDLSVSPNGLLINGDGVAVIGNSGPIAVAPGSTVSIGADGAVLVRNSADPQAPPARVDQLKLTSWRGTPIDKGLDGLFRVVGGGVLPNDAAAQVESGMLEQSNVRTSEVMVAMIEAQRLFDMRTKLVATAKELDEGGASLMRINA